MIDSPGAKWCLGQARIWGRTWGPDPPWSFFLNKNVFSFFDSPIFYGGEGGCRHNDGPPLKVSLDTRLVSVPPWKQSAYSYQYVFEILKSDLIGLAYSNFLTQSILTATTLPVLFPSTYRIIHERICSMVLLARTDYRAICSLYKFIPLLLENLLTCNRLLTELQQWTHICRSSYCWNFLKLWGYCINNIKIDDRMRTVITNHQPQWSLGISFGLMFRRPIRMIWLFIGKNFPTYS